MSSLKSADKIIAPSNFLKKYYERAGVEPGKIIYMRQGINLAETSRTKIKSEERPFQIAFIGQIAEHKGVHLILEASKYLKINYQIFIYGDDSKHPEYSSELLGRINGIKEVEFKGVFSPDEKESVYQQADCIVVPSIWYENSPNVIIEAQSYGKPVIASDLGGMKEMIEEGITGELFEAGCPESLAKAVERTAENYDTYQFNNLEYTSIKAEVKKILDLYQIAGRENG